MFESADYIKTKWFLYETRFGIMIQYYIYV